MAKVLRIFSGAALLIVLLAGCGSAQQDSTRHGVPRALAHEWESRASAIASAAAAGNSCEAQSLAASLRDDVVASQGKVPRRLRSALLTGVNSLADRTTCRHVVTVQAPPTKPGPKEPKPKHEPKPPKPHEPHDHGKRHDK